MPTTGRLALPYPVPADTADVPRDIQALATKIDGISTISPPFIAAPSPLPTTPTDGDWIFYSAHTGEGKTWLLRYNAGASSAYKWDVLGGPTVHTEQPNSQNGPATLNAWVEPVGTARIAAPLDGDYEVWAQAVMKATNAATLGLGVALTTALTPPFSRGVYHSIAANQYVTHNLYATMTGVAKGQNICLVVHGGGSVTGWTMQTVRLAVRPIRVL